MRFCESTRYFTLAESLGGVESLCGLEDDACGYAEGTSGVYDDLIRLSVVLRMKGMC
jgi:cystathionine beta-lyase/cystathionine gamma-synthase